MDRWMICFIVSQIFFTLCRFCSVACLLDFLIFLIQTWISILQNHELFAQCTTPTLRPSRIPRPRRLWSPSARICPRRRIRPSTPRRLRSSPRGGLRTPAGRGALRSPPSWCLPSATATSSEHSVCEGGGEAFGKP